LSPGLAAGSDEELITSVLARVVLPKTVDDENKLGRSSISERRRGPALECKSAKGKTCSSKMTSLEI
jgi:hypothetical protein